MRRSLQLGVGLLVLAEFSRAAPAIDATRYVKDVRYLSSSAFDGRGSGSAGLDKAANFIARQFAKAGLRPVGSNGFFQPFPVSVRSTLGDKNSFSYCLSGTGRTLDSDEFLPFNFSGEGKADGQIVFAGYGITAPEYSYDDYAGIDARGKIVVVMRHEPQEYDNGSAFEGRIYTEHSQWFSKAWNARVHGAKAMIVVNDVLNHSSDALEPFVSLVGPADPGLLVVQVKTSVADSWFEAAGKSLRSTEEAIDNEGKPQSFAFPDTLEVSLSVHVQHVAKNIRNVVGYVPGETSEYIVIGAHYDHLGHGEQFSLAPNMVGTPHPGADDNASGTAGLLALARWFGSRPKMKRGVVFVAFAGEEIGLLGSSYYVHHPLLPLQNATLMINMDMIGRIRDRKVMVTGGAAGTALHKALLRLEPKYDLKLQLDDGGVYGSSDHTAFKTKLIPILFFFSGLHSDYHKPSDTWDKIDGPDAVRLLRLIADLTAEVAAGGDRLQFVRSLAGPQSSAKTLIETSQGADK